MVRAPFARIDVYPRLPLAMARRNEAVRPDGIESRPYVRTTTYRSVVTELSALYCDRTFGSRIGLHSVPYLKWTRGSSSRWPRPAISYADRLTSSCDPPSGPETAGYSHIFGVNSHFVLDTFSGALCGMSPTSS